MGYSIPDTVMKLLVILSTPKILKELWGLLDSFGLRDKIFFICKFYVSPLMLLLAKWLTFGGIPSNRRLQNLSKVQSVHTFISALRDTSTVEALANSLIPFGVPRSPVTVLSCSWVSGLRNWPPWPCNIEYQSGTGWAPTGLSWKVKLSSALNL